MQADVAIYRHPDEFPDDVRRLYELAEQDSVAFGTHWFRNYLRTVAHGADGVHFHVLRRDGRAVAALALVAKRSGWPLHRAVEALGNYYTALYAPAIDPQLDADGLAPLIGAVVR